MWADIISSLAPLHDCIQLQYSVLLIHVILIIKAKYGAEYMCGVNVNIDTIIYNRIGLCSLRITTKED